MFQFDEPFVALAPPSAKERPADADPAAWRAYWQAQGQPWRREPEIPYYQQNDLRRRLSGEITSGGSTPLYFQRLTRADVEWLLATLDDGRGPIDWSDPAQRTRAGLDLRGARLEGADLSGLPLAGLRAGFSPEEWRALGGEGVSVARSEVNFARANLRDANLTGAHLEGANLNYAYLNGATFDDATLDDATLLYARLDPDLDRSDSSKRGASLARASARKTIFTSAWMQGVTLDDARLEGADLRETRLEGASLRRAHLEGADLRRASLDDLTDLGGAALGDGNVFAALGGARLIGVDLTSVDWAPVARLGDETIARSTAGPDGAKKTREERITEFAAAARAYRLLSQTLQRQGLDGPAGEFSYRAQTLQRELTLRRILWRGRAGQLGTYLFSALLATLTGYGYRMGRILRAYALLVVAFACVYFALGLAGGPRLQWYEALFVSLTAFHGRVFAEVFQPGSAQIWVTAGEAICGLLVESVFIAMLTRRFFGRG